MAEVSAADDRPAQSGQTDDPSLTATRLGLGVLRRRASRFRRRCVDEHANRPARRSPHHQPRTPGGTAVSPVSGRDATGRWSPASRRWCSRVAFFGYLAWRSIRERRPHWLLIVGIAAFFAGALDPLANWATFTVFDPRVAHFPLSWPYFNASPLLEPTLSFLGGYASYYVLTGLGLLSIHQRFIEPRIRRNGWLDRHRLVAVFITGFLAGLPLNAFMQFMWLKVGLFVYTEAAGPVLHLFGRQLPLYMVIYDSVLFAIVALLCVRDDSGRPALVAKLAQRLPGLGRTDHHRATDRDRDGGADERRRCCRSPCSACCASAVIPGPPTTSGPIRPSRSTTPTATSSGQANRDRSTE